jgi:hypothetical protein
MTMRSRDTYTAVLVHTSGTRRGTREHIEMPLVGPRPPEVLRRPGNTDGSPTFETWTLASLDLWGEVPRQAIYAFGGHTHRDPTVPPRYELGDVLPWKVGG